MKNLTHSNKMLRIVLDLAMVLMNKKFSLEKSRNSFSFVTLSDENTNVPISGDP